MFGLERDRPLRMGVGVCRNCTREHPLQKLAEYDGLCQLCHYFINGEYETDKMRMAEAIQGILAELQQRKEQMSEDRVVMKAYALYDADPRVNGPDDADAFRDSIRQAFSCYNAEA